MGRARPAARRERFYDVDGFLAGASTLRALPPLPSLRREAGGIYRFRPGVPSLPLMHSLVARAD